MYPFTILTHPQVRDTGYVFRSLWFASSAHTFSQSVSEPSPQPSQTSSKTSNIPAPRYHSLTNPQVVKRSNMWCWSLPLRRPLFSKVGEWGIRSLILYWYPGIQNAAVLTLRTYALWDCSKIVLWPLIFLNVVRSSPIWSWGNEELTYPCSSLGRICNPNIHRNCPHTKFAE